MAFLRPGQNVLKVAIGYHIQAGPWGGGNAFARSLSDALVARGDQVVHTLDHPDIDLILLTDPRGRSPQVSFHAGTILRYLATNYPDAVVVHRINECDERKGTRNMNRLLRRANYVADHTVFIASWLKELGVWRGESSSSVILNGADTYVFNDTCYRPWGRDEPLKLVTHHWGGNKLKGADVYEALDRLLNEPEWRGRLEFSYVGNIPAGTALPNTRYVAPLSGAALARELSSHHVYLTGSVNEPAGMHHIEGALCGLPLLYRNSGALPEYCSGYGIGFDDVEGFRSALERMMCEYSRYREAMTSYKNTAQRMCQGYLSLFDELLAKRTTIVARRQMWRDPWLVARNQVPF